MTRVAIISDVHCDHRALEDALDQIRRLGCDHILCCGDLVDSERSPDRIIQLARENNIQCVRGNHERWTLATAKHLSSSHARSDRRFISPESVEFLRDLPASLQLELDGVRISVHHGRPGSDMDGLHPPTAKPDELHQIIATAEADVLAVGHTHLPSLYRTATGQLLVDPGMLLRDPSLYPWGAQVYDKARGAFVQVPDCPRGIFGVLTTPELDFRVLSATDGQEIPLD